MTTTDTSHIAGYARVSTAEQSLSRQISSILKYSDSEFDVDLNGGDADQLAEDIESVGGGDPYPVGDVTVYHDKSTGTNTNRSGYREMMDEVEAGAVDAIVIHDSTRLSRSLNDLDRFVERATDHGASVHFVRDNLPAFTSDEDDAMNRLMLQILGAFAEWEVRMKRQNTKEGIAAREAADDDYHHGRPPFGFEKEDGHLYPGDRYHEIVAVLDEVMKDEMSKRQAAKELATSRRTINRALERAELYGL